MPVNPSYNNLNSAESPGSAVTAKRAAPRIERPPAEEAISHQLSAIRHQLSWFYFTMNFQYGVQVAPPSMLTRQ